MPAILLVDDRPENLVALEAILEPLGQELVSVGSGEDALRVLLHRPDFAVILLDAQMPVMDGFETAAAIKERERTRDIPVIFLTAISKDEEHVYRGYEVGAVDYVFKPLNPHILRGKVSVFVELYEKNDELRRQRELIALQELAAVRREGAERYRQLADAMPQVVWTADSTGRSTYFNRRFVQYTGVELDGSDEVWESVVHPEDAGGMLERKAASIESGAVFEAEYRIRSHDGSYRWHLGRAIPIHGAEGGIDFWIGTATDIDDRKRIEQGQQFLLDAGAELARSLDYRETLAGVARLAVPRFADWCSIDIVESEGTVVQLALAHADPDKVALVRELRERYPEQAGRVAGGPAVIESGVPQLLAEVDEAMLAEAAVDDDHRALIQAIGVRSWISVPLVSRGQTLGAISLVTAESGRVFDEGDLRVAEELARSAATAVDNARLYEQAEYRARAARALQTIADGVALLDDDGTVLLWNEAAQAITGIQASTLVGRNASEVFALSEQAAAANVPLDGSRAETLPVEIDGRELWLSVSRVKFDDGTVYAFRDVSQERALEQMRSDMVATVSHELRTPLAAIYGAAVTLQRREDDLDEEVKVSLVRVVAEESERLARIIGEVLLANHLDSRKVKLQIETVDPFELTESVVEAARVHLPDGISLEVDRPARLPAVAADAQHLRQVLVNLVENAVKYSPDGGPVTISLRRRDRYVEWAVSDVGLGIPPSERRRVFEKFYRLDPNMTRGIGGTGLGLYICRELVHRLDGRIWVDANNGKGSTFFVRIPAVNEPAKKRKSRTRQAA